MFDFPHAHRLRCTFRFRLIAALFMFAFAVLAAAESGCAPDEIEGEVLREEWTDYECTASLRIHSGDIVRVRFVLAIKGRAGYERVSLKSEGLTGKRVRCTLGMGFTVAACTILDSSGTRKLRRIGER